MAIDNMAAIQNNNKQQVSLEVSKDANEKLYSYILATLNDTQREANSRNLSEGLREDGSSNYTVKRAINAADEINLKKVILL